MLLESEADVLVLVLSPNSNVTLVKEINLTRPHFIICKISRLGVLQIPSSNRVL